ncbi:MAG: cysteate synthase [Bacteroidales bacterium]|nr:cysteate synthase [Bacteroidales bacterium]
MNSFRRTKYTLISSATLKEFADDGLIINDPDGKNSLIKSKYEVKEIAFRNDENGLMRYADWLPVNRPLAYTNAPIAYRSEGLANHLGLNNLWITFSGWWPLRGAKMQTCSFKETEAYAVTMRMKEKEDDVLVVASAGNTARAFARVCSDNNINVLLCIPYDNLNALWHSEPIAPCVKVVATTSGSDYSDAIELGRRICQIDGFRSEGGAHNIARRDGMGTCLLSAVEAIGHIPDAYFQAVGSGTGAIATWETYKRLRGDGRWGSNNMRLIVSQNAPFMPIFDSWKMQQRHMLPYDAELSRRKSALISASVLANRFPPYSVIGGLYDALTESHGDVMTVGNDEGHLASHLFRSTEGIDIAPAASIAVASLIKAVKTGVVDADQTILLNVTGGGEGLFKKSHNTSIMRPNHIFNIDAQLSDIEPVVRRLFNK